MAKRSIAVLIDGDNVQPKIIEQLLFWVSKHGKPIIKKVFLNKSSLPKWEVPINEYSLTPVWVPNNVRGKNAADIELVIDAMVLLYERQDLAGFCIVSSDSDFTGLAKRIVSKGKEVFGVGEQKTPESFSNACDDFEYIEELPSIETPIVETIIDLSDVSDISSIGVQSIDSLFIRAYEITTQNTDGRIPLPEIKEAMNGLDPDFQSSEYQNTKRLAEAVESLSMSYPENLMQVKVVEHPENKSVLHQIYVEDSDLFKFIEAYRNSSAVNYDRWLRLSIFLDEVRKYPAYENGFAYRGAKRLKAVKLLIQDYKDIIEMREENNGNSTTHFIRLRL